MHISRRAAGALALSLAVWLPGTGVPAATAAPTVTPQEYFSPPVVDAVLDGRPAAPHEWFPTPPQDDPFYVAPAVDPATPAGTLLRSRKVAPQNVLIRFGGLDAWQVLYTSTGLDGGPRVVSGIVLVPHTYGQAGPERVVSYLEANDNLAPGCGPSYRWVGGNTVDLAQVSLGPIPQMLARGWAVAMTDFGNNGEPGPQPFSVGALSGPAALDILRAVEQVPDAPIGPDAPAAIFGLAGGGVAGTTAAEMAGTYAPERRIVGSVLQGMVVDSTTFEHFAGGELAAGFVVANALGYAAAYPEIDLDSKLTPLGRQVADVFHRSCQFVYGLTPGLPLQAVFAGGLPSDDPAFRRRYDEGRLGRGVPNAPVYLSSCPTDCLVPYSDVLWLADRYAEGGASVTIDPTECGFQDFVRDPWRASTELVGVQGVPWLEQRFDADARGDRGVPGLHHVLEPTDGGAAAGSRAAGVGSEAS
jgi:hypothetical protein